MLSRYGVCVVASNTGSSGSFCRQLAWTSTFSMPKQWIDTRRQQQQQQQQKRSMSLESSSDEENMRLRSAVVSKLGIGSHKWRTLMNNNGYQTIVETALANGITTIEVGQDGGDLVLESILSASSQQQQQERANLLKRIGYRTTLRTNKPPPNETSNENNNNISSKEEMSLPGDVHVEDIPQTNAGQDTGAVVSVVHNLSQHAIRAALDESPLYHNKSKANNNFDLTILLHNPEVQGGDGATTELRQARICDKLTESFLALEQEIQNNLGRVTSYGIVSNGLCLPKDHPLHLSWKEAVAPALKQAQLQLADRTDLKFHIVQLPLNVIETTGLDVAKEIKNDNPSIQIHAIRPLTAYPDRGTGSGYPLVLADYLLPATMEKELMWSNEMTSPPQVYEVALQAAMRHFDAQDILQAKTTGQELTPEQRETLDGCKLMQSMLHDLDSLDFLERVQSWERHEQKLYGEIIPLIHGTFESYDETTAAVLQRFFASYSLAIRFYLARNTRKFLLSQQQQPNKNNNNNSPTPESSSLILSRQDMRLQDFALRFVLAHSEWIDKIVVGCTQVDQLLYDMDVVHQFLLSSSSSSIQDQ